MIITVETKRQKRKVKSWYNRKFEEKHTEIVEITTVWFLFFPIYRKLKLVSTSL